MENIIWKDHIGERVTVRECRTGGANSYSDYIDSVDIVNGKECLTLHYSRQLQPTDVSNGWWVWLMK